MPPATSGSPDHLLDPAGVAVLRRAQARPSRGMVLLAVVAVLLLALPTVVYVVAEGSHQLGGDRLDHLLGRTAQVTAQVDSVQEVGHCGRASESRDQFRIELSWTTGPPPGHSAFLACDRALAVGESVPAWVDADGYVQLASPTSVRLAAGGIGLGLSIFALGLGAAMLIPARQRRRRLLAAGDTLLLPAVPVVVEPYDQKTLGFRLIPAPQAAGAALPISAIPILYGAAGQQPKLSTVRKLRGTWKFRAGPVTGVNRQLGVLERGQERCWVEGRLLRR
ncbi:hypothetical protein [Georgenia sunbinii]|uniref:hypothetical protein n=1 Tax=Georgenia sunbinii TaxID=3117728 RepID=UPI002F267A0B